MYGLHVFVARFPLIVATILDRFYHPVIGSSQWFSSQTSCSIITAAWYMSKCAMTFIFKPALVKRHVVQHEPLTHSNMRRVS